MHYTLAITLETERRETERESKISAHVRVPVFCLTYIMRQNTGTLHMCRYINHLCICTCGRLYFPCTCVIVIMYLLLFIIIIIACFHGIRQDLTSYCCTCCHTVSCMYTHTHTLPGVCVCVCYFMLIKCLCTMTTLPSLSLYLFTCYLYHFLTQT